MAGSGEDTPARAGDASCGKGVCSACKAGGNCAAVVGAGTVAVAAPCAICCRRWWWWWWCWRWRRDDECSFSAEQSAHSYTIRPSNHEPRPARKRVQALSPSAGTYVKRLRLAGFTRLSVIHAETGTVTAPTRAGRRCRRQQQHSPSSSSSSPSPSPPLSPSISCPSLAAAAGPSSCRCRRRRCRHCCCHCCCCCCRRDRDRRRRLMAMTRSTSRMPTIPTMRSPT